jgi:hypothetical protein
LTWASEVGFAEIIQSIRPDLPYTSAHEWRQRDMLRVMNRFLAAHGIDPGR